MVQVLQVQIQVEDSVFFQAVAQKEFSQFPPPARTLLGAWRYFLHDVSGILPAARDGSQALKPLRIRGPYLRLGQTRLLPYPIYPGLADVLSQAESVPMECAPRYWLRAQDWPARPDALADCALDAARDLTSPHRRDGVQALRLHEALAFDLFCYVTPQHAARWPQACEVLQQVASFLSRYGAQEITLGKNTTAQLSLCATWDAPATPWLALPAPSPSPSTSSSNQATDQMLCFVQPADFNGAVLPANFTQQANGNWRGFADAALGLELEIIDQWHAPLTLQAGWHMQHSHPRPSRALLPAGSLWHCKLLRGQVQDLHGLQWGSGRELGRGEAYCMPVVHL